MNTTTVESDEWLMGRVRRGDRDALEKLVRRYASPLLTFIQRMLGDRHRAEELFQETFLRVWTKRRQYKLTNTFRGWLFTIAANACRDDFRRAKPTFRDDLDPTASADDDDPTATAMRSETAAMVAESVSQLPAVQRAVVVLRVWNGLSYAEIADITGTEEATARSNMHRGLATLRRSLEPRLR